MNSNSRFRQMLITDALFEGGRMFVGATSVTYLLHSGLSLSQIALLKSVQAITILLGEVPTGVLADSIGRKKSLLAASFCAVMGFGLYFMSNNFKLFILAEILTALSLCFWSGAFEALAIDEAKLEETPGKIDRFFHLNQSINSFAVLIFGFLGGLLGNLGLNFPYLAAIVAYLVMTTILLSIPENTQNQKTDFTQEPWLINVQKHLKATITQGLFHPALTPFFIANILLQFTLQPILHYWQPYFQNLNPHLGAEQQGWIFAAYCGTSALFGGVYAKYSHKPFLRSAKMTFMLFVMFSLLYTFLGHQTPWIIAMGVFCLLQGVLSVAKTSLGVRMNENIDATSRASILSSLSLISRLGMVGALFVISQLLPTEKNSEVTSMISLYKFFGLSTVILLLLIVFGLILTQRKRVSL